MHAECSEHRIEGRGPAGETLATDVAAVGARWPDRAVVVSSGLHGVEGFIGSAIQIAWLEGLAAGGGSLPDGTRAVFLHALNPYGFAWRRRVNERNVDLNRNFLEAGEDYSGVPPGYDLVHRLLNPSSAPGRLDTFQLQAGWAILRHGRQTLATAVAAGQYDHPDGLFFGGREPEATTRLVQTRYGEWISSAATVIHLDLHSGLGGWGESRLIVEPDQRAHHDWFRTVFHPVEVVLAGDGAPYAARGTMTAWLARHSGADRECRAAVVEFGTYSQVRVLATLRAEQSARRCGSSGSARASAATHALAECFCPMDVNWRRAVVEWGVRVIDQAITTGSRSRR